jgi:hypothetical protein
VLKRARHPDFQHLLRAKDQRLDRPHRHERGMTPPPLPEAAPRSTPETSLRGGVVMLALGLGLGLAAFFSQGPEVFSQPRGLAQALAISGAIVGSIGVGNLVYYAVARKRPPSLPTS